MKICFYRIILPGYIPESMKFKALYSGFSVSINPYVKANYEKNTMQCSVLFTDKYENVANIFAVLKNITTKKIYKIFRNTNPL